MIDSKQEKAYMIFLEDNVLLSKKEYTHWREIQDEYYEIFKTSFPLMTCDEIISYYSDDYGGDETTWPFSKERIRNFFQSDEIVLKSSVK